MKVFMLVGITKEKENNCSIAHSLLASYNKKSCEKKLKEISNSPSSSIYEQLIILENSVKKTNTMIVKEIDDKIKFHNNLVERGR